MNPHYFKYKEGYFAVSPDHTKVRTSCADIMLNGAGRLLECGREGFGIHEPRSEMTTDIAASHLRLRCSYDPCIVYLTFQYAYLAPAKVLRNFRHALLG